MDKQENDVSMPLEIQKRFQFTPGLAPFISAITNLSVITGKNVIELSNSFLDEYYSLVKKGDLHPALRAYQIVHQQSQT